MLCFGKQHSIFCSLKIITAKFSTNLLPQIPHRFNWLSTMMLFPMQNIHPTDRFGITDFPEINLCCLQVLMPLSIAAIIEPGFFAVMEPVQSVQKTVWDASFKTADSPPFLHSFFLFLDRCIFVVVDRMVWPDNFLRREQLYKRHAGADQLTRPRGCGLEKLRAIPECPDWM